MNFADHRTLACAYRDQGLADYLHARLFTSLPALNFGGQGVLPHCAVISKCQQASEKMIKGFLLWHRQDFDPTKRHNPLSDGLDDSTKYGGLIHNLSRTANKVHSQIFSNLLKLEKFAPCQPDIPPALAGGLLPLSVLNLENTEYPFWSEAHQKLVLPAQSFQYSHSLQYIRIIGRLCNILADIHGFGLGIHVFLEAHPLNRPIIFVEE